MRTEPVSGTKLSKSQTVTVYVSLGSNKMPNLVKESKENARKRLEAMDLNLNILFLEEASQDIDKDKVIRTEPSRDAEQGADRHGLCQHRRRPHQGAGCARQEP